MKRSIKNAFGQTYLIIEFDEKKNLIHNFWYGLLTVENVKHGATEVLDIMKQTNCTNLLNDNREIIGSWDQANDWIEKEWMPKALGLGLRQFAHVVSNGVFGELSAKEMQTRVGDKFEMRLFNDIDTAKSWLLQNNNN
ncbi:MAG: hypothetical protein EOP53_27100 [Sphingobacteriales bacterium]|nr:MAG: hypothetical protein EOP53_27100 [Sphingobacteriales bacterium]